MGNEELRKDNESLKKKIRKVVEEAIVCYQEEYSQKYTQEEIVDVLKHKAQVAKLAVEDNDLEDIILSEIEDCIGAYIIKKSFKKR